MDAYSIVCKHLKMSDFFSEVDRIKTFGQYCPRTVCGVTLRQVPLLNLPKQGFYCYDSELMVCAFCKRVIALEEYVLSGTDLQSHADSCTMVGNVVAPEEERLNILRTETALCAQDHSLRKGPANIRIEISLRSGDIEKYLDE